MTTTRRDFVKLLATIPIALQVTPLIGEETAGGFYAPPPLDMENYVHLHQAVQPLNQLIEVVKAEAYVLFAPLGSTTASVQMYGGTCTMTGGPELAEKKLKNLMQTFHETWKEDHYPGWLRVLRMDEGRYGDDGSVRTWHEWQRVSKLQWLRVDQWDKMGPGAAARAGFAA